MRRPSHSAAAHSRAPVAGWLGYGSVTPPPSLRIWFYAVSTQGDREPLSPGTVKHAYDMLRRPLKYAEKLKAIPINPATQSNSRPTAAQATAGG